MYMIATYQEKAKTLQLKLRVPSKKSEFSPLKCTKVYLSFLWREEETTVARKHAKNTEDYLETWHFNMVDFLEGDLQHL